MITANDKEAAMNRTLAILALILVLSTAGCSLAPAEQPEPTAQPEPLVLPYVIYEQEHCGNQFKITLIPPCDSTLKPDEYCFQIDIRAGEGQTQVGAMITTIRLTEGYRPGVAVNWEERVGDKTGAGSLHSGSIQPGTDLWDQVYTGVGQSSDPEAVFVRITATCQGSVVTTLDTTAPLAVLQILPEGRGVARLDK